MRSKLQALVVAASLLLSLGFHVAAIQGVAWARMYTDYQQRLSPIDALEQTLSGVELCGICQLSIELRDQADEALNSFYTTPSILLLAPTQEANLVAAPKASYHFLSIPHSRIPQATIREIEPPPPKSRIC